MSDQTKLSNTSKAQRTRLLTSLEQAQGEGVTSQYAQLELEVYYPPARVMELRRDGHNIVTNWVTIEGCISRPRRVARYVLISKAVDGSKGGG